MAKACSNDIFICCEDAGIDAIVLALGFRHELIEDELERLSWKPRPEIILNGRFDLGSVLTVHTVADAMTRGGEVLLMDADVLYDARIMRALVAGRQPVNRVLFDRDFEAGEEPVKLCMRDGVPIELRKQLAPDLRYDTIGESIGFFRFNERVRGGSRHWPPATSHATARRCRTRKRYGI